MRPQLSLFLKFTALERPLTSPSSSPPPISSLYARATISDYPGIRGALLSLSRRPRRGAQRGGFDRRGIERRNFRKIPAPDGSASASLQDLQRASIGGRGGGRHRFGRRAGSVGRRNVPADVRRPRRLVRPRGPGFGVVRPRDREGGRFAEARTGRRARIGRTRGSRRGRAEEEGGGEGRVLGISRGGGDDDAVPPSPRRPRSDVDVDARVYAVETDASPIGRVAVAPSRAAAVRVRVRVRAVYSVEKEVPQGRITVSPRGVRIIDVVAPPVGGVDVGVGARYGLEDLR